MGYIFYFIQKYLNAKLIFDDRIPHIEGSMPNIRKVSPAIIIAVSGLSRFWRDIGPNLQKNLKIILR